MRNKDQLCNTALMKFFFYIFLKMVAMATNNMNELAHRAFDSHPQGP